MSTAQSIMDLLNTDGWDGLGKEMSDSMKASMAQHAALEDLERKRQAQIYLDTFSTHAGQQALALMRAATFERPATQADLDERDPMVFAMLAQRRIGAANLVHQILSAIDYARGIKPGEGAVSAPDAS